MCRRVFNKTIILLGLAGYQMIITNSALRAGLVDYDHFMFFWLTTYHKHGNNLELLKFTINQLEIV